MNPNGGNIPKRSMTACLVRLGFRALRTKPGKIVFCGLVSAVGIQIYRHSDDIQNAVDSVKEKLGLNSSVYKQTLSVTDRGTKFIFDLEAPRDAKWNGVRPHWPAYESGVTLAAGYDLKLKNKNELHRDFKNYFSPTELAILEQGLRLKGEKAKAFVARADVQAIKLTYDQTFDAFKKVILPPYLKAAKSQWGRNLHKLPPDAQAALVAITIQRPHNGGKYRANLRKMKKALDRADLQGVTQALAEETQRFNTPKNRGIYNRYAQMLDLWKTATKGKYLVFDTQEVIKKNDTMRISATELPLPQALENIAKDPVRSPKITKKTVR
jgi:hypothetical protein